MSDKSSVLTPGRQHLLMLAAAIVILYIVVPQIGNFRDSLTLATDAQMSWLVLSVVFTTLSYVAAAGTYCLLAVRPLRYGRTLLIQLAGMFVNRLIPAGIGSISMNYLYLRRSRHTSVEAAGVVAANNSIGIVGHLLLMVTLLVPLHSHLPGLRLKHIAFLRPIAIITLLVIILWLLFYRRYRVRLAHGIEAFIKQFLTYRYRPGRLALALLTSVSLTMTNVLSLWFCVLAMHISLPFIAVLIVFSFGVALGTATPTPGGLGGVEAGLVAGLVVYHVDGASALAAVLVYRLISYWLPLLAGAMAFTISQRRKYI